MTKQLLAAERKVVVTLVEIELKEVLSRSDLLLIDVRSPGEYAEASIPGAINIPLFNDQEHHQLGIIYHQLGETEARRAALEMVAPKLPGLVDQVIEKCCGKKPLLYCRRGGLRSYSFCQILHLTGISSMRLKSGYKAYRRHINEQLAGYRLHNKLVVLHGLTGVGKTTVLEKLVALGVPILDLEELARHRGSVFGAVGLNRPRSQKDFDALLLQELEKLSGKPFFVVEGEGRRIGNIYMPPFLAEAMDKGHQILLTASIEARVERIVDTYIPELIPENLLDELKNALLSLEKRLGRQKVADLVSKLEQGDYHKVAEVMCLDYYDHFYRDSRPECSRFDVVVDASDLDSATLQVIEILGALDLAPAKTAPG